MFTVSDKKKETIFIGSKGTKCQLDLEEVLVPLVTSQVVDSECFSSRLKD